MPRHLSERASGEYAFPDKWNPTSAMLAIHVRQAQAVNLPFTHIKPVGVDL